MAKKEINDPRILYYRDKSSYNFFHQRNENVTNTFLAY